VDEIQALLDNEIPENDILEFKAALTLETGDQKRELLYDIVAFANSMGGDLLIGVDDRRNHEGKTTGIAGGLSGFQVGNLQLEVSRIENLVRDGIKPALVGIRFEHFVLSGGEILHIEIPKSWAAPHMVVIGGVNRFYGRGTSGKYPMSVEQIRRSFSQQEELRYQIERWRSDRLEILTGSESPRDLGNSARLIVHFIPTSAFLPSHGLWWTFSPEDRRNLFVHGKPRLSDNGGRFNGDGYFKPGGSTEPTIPGGYSQAFRSGILEYVSIDLSYVRRNAAVFEQIQDLHPRYVAPQRAEFHLVNAYEDARRIFIEREEKSPVYFGFMVIGAKGKPIFTGDFMNEPTDVIVDKSFISGMNLMGPTDEEKPFMESLKPLADTFWQLGGVEMSRYSAPDGTWNPPSK
jgi:hypothetical protein